MFGAGYTFSRPLASFPALGGALYLFSRSRPRYHELNSRCDWFITFSKPKLFFLPLCVSGVELRDKVVTLFLLLPLSLSYPGDKCDTEEPREMFTDTSSCQVNQFNSTLSCTFGISNTSRTPLLQLY